VFDAAKLHATDIFSKGFPLKNKGISLKDVGVSKFLFIFAHCIGSPLGDEKGIR
jgi:hypothetical protein